MIWTLSTSSFQCSLKTTVFQFLTWVTVTTLIWMPSVNLWQRPLPSREIAKKEGPLLKKTNKQKTKNKQTNKTNKHKQTNKQTNKNKTKQKERKTKTDKLKKNLKTKCWYLPTPPLSSSPFGHLWKKRERRKSYGEAFEVLKNILAKRRTLWN